MSDYAIILEETEDEIAKQQVITDFYHFFLLHFFSLLFPSCPLLSGSPKFPPSLSFVSDYLCWPLLRKLLTYYHIVYLHKILMKWKMNMKKCSVNQSYEIIQFGTDLTFHRKRNPLNFQRHQSIQSNNHPKNLPNNKKNQRKQLFLDRTLFSHT